MTNTVVSLICTVVLLTFAAAALLNWTGWF